MKRHFSVVAALVAVVLMISGSQAHAINLAPAPSPTIATNESFSSCTSLLCIDAPPEGPNGLDGSGGWGWNSATSAPVTTLTVGTAANFTVTVMQPNSGNFTLCGAADLTITLTYSSRDFTLSTTDSAGNIGVDPFDRGGVVTFTYTGDFLCHADQSIAYTFTPMNPTNTALVTATVSGGGQQAFETFPVQIIQKPERGR